MRGWVRKWGEVLGEGEFGEKVQGQGIRPFGACWCRQWVRGRGRGDERVRKRVVE